MHTAQMTLVSFSCENDEHVWSLATVARCRPTYFDIRGVVIRHHRDTMKSNDVRTRRPHTLDRTFVAQEFVNTFAIQFQGITNFVENGAQFGHHWTTHPLYV
jgi:hypothetical protein